MKYYVESIAITKSYQTIITHIFFDVQDKERKHVADEEKCTKMWIWKLLVNYQKDLDLQWVNNQFQMD